MMRKIKLLWIELKTSFWFVPSLMVVGSILLAFFAIEFEARVAQNLNSLNPRLFAVSAEGAREMLSTIAGSIMSMMAVTFSMTLVSLTLASSQYTSRILRNFMSSKITQMVLGTFAGIFTYCLVVLRTIRGGESGVFVPNLAVSLGFILALIGVGALILFIHHMAKSIQASSILESVCHETLLSLTNQFSSKTDADEVAEVGNGLTEKWLFVLAERSGYIQSLDLDSLLHQSCDMNTIFKVHYSVGEFVVEGTTIVSIADVTSLSDDTKEKILSSFSFDSHRTIEQDSAFGVRQIVDIALKALSPGVNDTTTAIMSIDYLTTILAKLVNCQFPSGYRFKNGELRVICRVESFQDYVFNSFKQICECAINNEAVIKHVYKSLFILVKLSNNKENSEFLKSEAAILNQKTSFSFN